MRVADMMDAASGKVFLKSESGQISDDWPCVSFTRESVGDRLRAQFRPRRDILIYVGTTNPAMTEDPSHRSCLISAVAVEPSQILATKNIVPVESWEASVRIWGERWPHAMAVVDAANMVGPPFPAAHDVIPRAYASFASFENRGGIVLAEGAERDAVMALEVKPIQLHLREQVCRNQETREVMRLVDRAIQQEAHRLAELITQRIERSGSMGMRLNPIRTGPSAVDLETLIARKWTDEQKGRCALCDGDLDARSRNPMLKASADRIDSSDIAYLKANLQITHLACNLAKNKWGAQEFADWLDVVRGSGTPS